MGIQPVYGKRSIIKNTTNIPVFVAFMEIMVKQKPEEKASQHIDKLLESAGWTIQDYPESNLGTSPGVAVCEFPQDSGFADYLLFLDRSAGGVMEAKPEGTTSSGVSEQKTNNR